MSHLNDLYGSSKGRRGSRSEVKKAPAKAAAEKKKSVMDEFNVTVKRAPESQVSGETDILASTMKQNSGGMDQHTTMLGILGSRAQALRVGELGPGLGMRSTGLPGRRQSVMAPSPKRGTTLASGRRIARVRVRVRGSVCTVAWWLTEEGGETGGLLG